MERFARPRALQARLGDPFDPESALSHARTAQWDEDEQYPQEALDLLHEHGLARDFIPVAHGGELRGYDELVSLARVLAERDLSVAVTVSAAVWSTLLWIAGDESAQQRHAASLLAGRTPCLAYSEEAHGADLLAADTVAQPVAGGYRVRGRKWPINRAATGQSVVLLARTGEPNHPRGQSLFWFEKEALAPGQCRALPRVPTLGVRGCDISGLVFEDAFLPGTCRVGPEGAGLELALKGFHVTRTLCTGLSLGAVDAALRTTVRLARSRTLYGDTLLALPQVRQTLTEVYALLLALESASLAYARLLHTSPGQSSTISAIAKFSIPKLAEELVRRLAEIHGARFYMREHHDWGLMQRVYRNNLLISIFDGSAPVNLHALSAQLPLLARFAPKDLTAPAEQRRASSARERAALACTIQAAPPAFRGSELELVSRGEDDLLHALALLCAELTLHGAPPPVVQLASALQHALQELYAEIHAHEQARRSAARSAASAPALYQMAERYALLHTAAAALHVWWRNEPQEPWIITALSQLLPRAHTTITAPSPEREALFQDLLRRSDEPGGYHKVSRHEHPRRP